jgi:hypothetical protein
MTAFFANGWHYIMGLAVIGAVSALAVTGTIAGATAMYVIDAVGSALIGGGLALSTAAAPPGTVTTTSTPVATVVSPGAGKAS